MGRRKAGRRKACPEESGTHADGRLRTGGGRNDLGKRQHAASPFDAVLSVRVRPRGWAKPLAQGAQCPQFPASNPAQPDRKRPGRCLFRQQKNGCAPDGSGCGNRSRICPKDLPVRRGGYCFLPLGASIMFIFLPSSFGIISTLANSSRSVAKRSSRISPCSLKTIERPRKKT